MSDSSSFLMRALKIEWIRPPEFLRLTEAEKTIQQLRMQLMQKEQEQKDDVRLDLLIFSSLLLPLA